MPFAASEVANVSYFCAGTPSAGRNSRPGDRVAASTDASRRSWKRWPSAATTSRDSTGIGEVCTRVTASPYPAGMELHTWLHVLAGLLMLVGFLGTVLPVLPGLPL